MQVEGQELTEYLKAVAEAAENGLKNTEFIVSPQDTIIVELAVVNTKKAEGGLKILVLKAEGQYNKDEISKITIPIRRKKEYPVRSR